jgi:hypothetical protein
MSLIIEDAPVKPSKPRKGLSDTLVAALEALAGTELDNRGNRIRLGRLTEEDQRRIAEDLRAGNLIGARVRLRTPAPPKDPEAPVFAPMNRQTMSQLERITKAWDDASEEARIRFVRRLRRRRVPPNQIPEI